MAVRIFRSWRVGTTTEKSRAAITIHERRPHEIALNLAGQAQLANWASPTQRELSRRQECPNVEVKSPAREASVGELLVRCHLDSMPRRKINGRLNPRLSGWADGFSNDLGLVRLQSYSNHSHEERLAYAPLIQKGKARVMRLKGYGNAIVPQLAVEFIKAYMSIGESI